MTVVMQEQNEPDFVLRGNLAVSTVSSRFSCPTPLEAGAAACSGLSFRSILLGGLFCLVLASSGSLPCLSTFCIVLVYSVLFLSIF